MAHLSRRSPSSPAESQQSSPSVATANKSRCAAPVGGSASEEKRVARGDFHSSFQRWWSFWKSKTVVEKVRLYSIVANTAFMALMISRYLSERRSTERLWEEELERKSSETGDWRCYHAHRLFHSQCRDISPTQWPGVRTSPTDVKSNSPGDSSSSSVSSSPTLESADTLCGRLETTLRQCRDGLADLLPEETPAMQPIKDITNIPPWLKERPVYEQFFKEKELKEAGGAAKDLGSP